MIKNHGMRVIAHKIKSIPCGNLNGEWRRVWTLSVVWECCFRGPPVGQNSSSA
ncbi:MAG: hypothetical protein Q4D28_01875 [Prevotellaceae bacterium]|nr:hypothetical protein [Prevotellaceae bacterium]